ncbi:MAG: hypothetical protein R6U11_07705 [Bacteroidales bacterium]
MKCKKGSIGDKVYLIYFFVLVMLFLVIYVSQVFTPTWNAVQDVTKESERTQDVLDNIKPEMVNQWMDVALVFAYFSLQIIISIYLPMKVPYNPIYLVVLFFFSFVLTYAVAILSNVIYPIIVEMNSQIVLTKILVEYWVLIEVFFLLIMGLIVYYKPKEPNDGGINYGY